MRSGGLPAIVPLHFALVAIELVIGAANKLTFPAADLVAERGGATMLRRNLNHPLAASLPPQMAKGSINAYESKCARARISRHANFEGFGRFNSLAFSSFVFIQLESHLISRKNFTLKSV